MCEWGGHRRGLCEMVVCHPNKAVSAAWACCFQGCVEGRVASWWCVLCLGEKMARLLLPDCYCQSYHFRNTDIWCLVCLYQTVGDALLADTSVSYPGILLAASDFCTVVAFRCCEMKS